MVEQVNRYAREGQAVTGRRVLGERCVQISLGDQGAA
jgi:hypothetical protein